MEAEEAKAPSLIKWRIDKRSWHLRNFTFENRLSARNSDTVFVCRLEKDVIKWESFFLTSWFWHFKPIFWLSNEFPLFRLLCDGFWVSWPESVVFSSYTVWAPHKQTLSSHRNGWTAESQKKLLVSSGCCAGHTKFLRGPNVARGPRVRHPWHWRMAFFVTLLKLTASDFRVGLF